MQQDRLLIQQFRKKLKFCARKPHQIRQPTRLSIYLILICQTQHFRNVLSHFPCKKDIHDAQLEKTENWEDKILSIRPIVRLAAYAVAIFTMVCLFRSFSVLWGSSDKYCPTTFLFFCLRLFCFSHLWLPIKYFWPISLGLWLMVFRLVTEATYS